MVGVLDNVIGDWYEVQWSRGFIAVAHLNLRFFLSEDQYPNHLKKKKRCLSISWCSSVD